MKIFNHLKAGWGNTASIDLMDPGRSGQFGDFLDSLKKIVKFIKLKLKKCEQNVFFFINDQNNFTKLPNQKTNFELRDVGVNIFSYEYCLEKTVYTSQYVNSDTDICAGVPDNDNDGMADGGKDSCQGNNSGQKKENILTRINNLNVQINNSDNIIF